jgi:hypothetical protein
MDNLWELSSQHIDMVNTLTIITPMKQTRHGANRGGPRQTGVFGLNAP